MAAESSPKEKLGGEPNSMTANAEDPALAKSANDEEPRPAEVPESDPTNADTNNDVLLKAEEPTDEVSGTEKAEVVDDEGEHVVAGDEDTVIY